VWVVPPRAGECVGRSAGSRDAGFVILECGRLSWGPSLSASGASFIMTFLACVKFQLRYPVIQLSSYPAGSAGVDRGIGFHRRFEVHRPRRMGMAQGIGTLTAN
jgi:hypothetical protein